MKRPEILKIKIEDTLQENTKKRVLYYNLLEKWKRDTIYSAYFGLTCKEIAEANNIVNSVVGPIRNFGITNEEQEVKSNEFFESVEKQAKIISNKRIENKLLNFNWFKVVVSIFLLGILYVSYNYVEAYKQSSKNGRYIRAADFYNMDTQTGKVDVGVDQPQ